MKLIGKHGTLLFDHTKGKGVAIINSPILQKKYGEKVDFEPQDLIKWIGRLKIHSTEDGRIQFGTWES